MKAFLLCMGLVVAAPCLAQAQCVTDDPTTYAKDCAAAAKLQAALKAGDKQAVARMVTYPLRRDAPLKPIASAAELLKHWDEFFDATTTKDLIEQDPSQYGWRGIAMVNGMVWFKDGRIVTINSQAAAYDKALADAKAAEGKMLYASAQGYDRIEFQCSTKALQVRVERYGTELRYFAWKKSTALSSKPDLEIHNGTAEGGGSDGSAVLTFHNDGFTYELGNGAGICGEDCNNYLVVSKAGNPVSKQVCNAATGK